MHDSGSGIDGGGPIAVVTGGGSGIGRAVSLGLRAEGFRVAVADLDIAAARNTVAEAGGGVAVETDVSEPGSVERLREAVDRGLGVPHVVVSCAGFTRSEPFLENTVELVEKILAVNLMGTVLVARAFLPAMVGRGNGRIVTLASDAGRVGSTGETVYAGAKGGVIAFTKSLAREMAPHGIAVNCVSPGPTDTPMLHQQPEKYREALRRAIPLKRVGRPEEIADAAIYLASSRASYITGQVLSVSGGLTMVD